MTLHGRSPGATVAFDGSSSGLVDGVKDDTCVEELVLSPIETSGDVSVIQAIVARWNEERGHGNAKCIGNPLNDLDADVCDASFDSGDGGARDPCELRELFLREPGPRTSDDDVDAARTGISRLPTRSTTRRLARGGALELYEACDVAWPIAKQVARNGRARKPEVLA